MFARSLYDVEVSPQNASRTELEFLAEVVEAAIDAGATTINVPDTGRHGRNRRVTLMIMARFRQGIRNEQERAALRQQPDSRGRDMKFYRLTPAGRKQLTVEESRWRAIVRAMTRMLRPA
jgi:hypothetical protein